MLHVSFLCGSCWFGMGSLAQVTGFLGIPAGSLDKPCSAEALMHAAATVDAINMGSLFSVGVWVHLFHITCGAA